MCVMDKERKAENWCRSEKTRIRIVKEYDLIVHAHAKLLIGQRKRSCTDVPLIDTYYCFAYKSKTGNDKGSFFCGSHAAAHFLKLTGLPNKPLFNPLVADEHSGVGSGSSNSTSRRWDPAAKQLINAIQLILACWDEEPKYALIDVNEYVERYYDKSPHISRVKSVNTVISYDRKSRNLQLMIADLKKKGNEMRNFDFSLLNAILEKEDMPSNFG